ncbi:MAG: hypothetical protein KAR42_05825 [candidate division Zixibacteria bacterium]|nr:hypothetical protein [candidate division Zixibacteria bacterium]
MKRPDSNSTLSDRTRLFIQEQTGLEISQSEADEIRQSLVRYSRILLEISQNDQKEECNYEKI